MPTQAAGSETPWSRSATAEYLSERGTYDMTLVTPKTPITAPEWGELASLLTKAGYGGEDVRLLKANMPRFTTLLDELGGKVNPLLTADWLDALMAAEQTALRAFFGAEFDLTRFRETLAHYGQDQLQKWAELGLEPHFLPELVLTQATELPGWKVKPNDFYWNQLEAGNLLRPRAQFFDYRDNTGTLEPVREARLEGNTVLVDTRLKPRYKDGRQMWPSDKPYLGGIIAKLRKEGVIQAYGYGSQASRFGVSANEWEEHIRPALAAHLGLRPDQLRLESALEANVIPQLFTGMARAKDGQTDTWVWYEERFGSAAVRLGGGNSSYGGLARVFWLNASSRDYDLAFRPLGVLDT